jgi:hypothetical protein
MSTTDPQVTESTPSSYARPVSAAGRRRSEQADQTVLISYLRNRAMLVDASTGKSCWEIQTDQDLRELVHGGEIVYLAGGAGMGEDAPRTVPRQMPDQAPGRHEVHMAGEHFADSGDVELDRVIPDPSRPHGFLVRTSPREGLLIERRFVAAQVEARRVWDGALLWRFGGPTLIGTAQMRLHEGTLAVLSPFGSIPPTDISLYGLHARTGTPRWIRDYRAEGLRLRTPPLQAQPGESAPDATGRTDQAAMTARTERWRTGEWRLLNKQTSQSREPNVTAPLERIERGSLLLIGEGGGLLFLRVRLLGPTGNPTWALERVEAVDAVTGDTRWTVSTPLGCDIAVSPAGRIVALWQRDHRPLLTNDSTRVMLLDGPSGQLLSRFQLGASHVEDQRLQAAPVEVAPTRTADIFLGVTDDGVAYLAHESRGPTGGDVVRTLSAVPVVDRALNRSEPQSVSASNDISGARPTPATGATSVDTPTPMDVPMWSDWDALDWDAIPAPKPLWTAPTPPRSSESAFMSAFIAWAALGPEAILTSLETLRASNGQHAYIALRGLDPATGAERWTWHSPKSLAELIGVWRGRAPGAFGGSILRDLRPRWGAAIAHVRDQHTMWREQDHLPREPRGALGQVVDRVKFWGEVIGSYREDLLYHWRVGQWRAPATLLTYKVTRDAERVYIASRIGLFALSVRDGRLRWFAAPNEECAAASLGHVRLPE